MDLQFKVWFEAEEQPWTWGQAAKGVAKTAGGFLKKAQPFLQRMQYGRYGYGKGERFLGAAIDTALGTPVPEDPYQRFKQGIEQEEAKRKNTISAMGIVSQIFPSFTHLSDIHKMEDEKKIGEATVRQLFNIHDANMYYFGQPKQFKDKPEIKQMLDNRLQSVLNDPKVQKLTQELNNYTRNPNMRQYVDAKEKELTDAVNDLITTLSNPGAIPAGPAPSAPVGPSL